MLLSNLTIVRTPKFQSLLRRCTNATVERVFAMSSDGPNNDGIDTSSCQDVVIRDCVVDAGDDCFAVQAGSLPCSGVLIQDSELHRGHAAVAFGSSASAGISNVIARRLRMVDSRLQFGLRIKLNTSTGGSVRDVILHSAQAAGLTENCVEINFNYGSAVGSNSPVVSNVRVSELLVGGDVLTPPVRAKNAIYLDGLQDSHINDVQLTNCQFNSVQTPTFVQWVDGLAVDGVTINHARWP